ncbi:MAG: PIN domain-containing protein [Acidobacteriota bacterium]
MTVLLDADVLIGCLRGVAPARAWLSECAPQTFGVPGIVAMELLVGCRNSTELRDTEAFLGSFNVLRPEAAECARAYELMKIYRLSSASSIPDYLIAAMALSRNRRLYS